mmetsp:Transcript_18783/g.59889  ORF Transcript_18783/g.59889 Transcript_18783/m.59889 type:complete len:267 (-) Transcript_18783:1448-2248(-)
MSIMRTCTCLSTISPLAETSAEICSEYTLYTCSICWKMPNSCGANACPTVSQSCTLSSMMAPSDLAVSVAYRVATLALASLMMRPHAAFSSLTARKSSSFCSPPALSTDNVTPMAWKKVRFCICVSSDVMDGRLTRMKRRNTSDSPCCTLTNLARHFLQILRKVSHAMSCTPGCVSCMNSNSLFTTVLRNFQCAIRKRGYCPTMYMMLDAMTALLFLPLVTSHMRSRSRMKVTKKRFSSSSVMVPLMEPTDQHSVFSASQVHEPVI